MQCTVCWWKAQDAVHGLLMWGTRCSAGLTRSVEVCWCLRSLDSLSRAPPQRRTAQAEAYPQILAAVQSGGVLGGRKMYLWAQRCESPGVQVCTRCRGQSSKA
eukprot:366453-Chlamydomonas_euryale.AAC.9